MSPIYMSTNRDSFRSRLACVLQSTFQKIKSCCLTSKTPDIIVVEEKPNEEWAAQNGNQDYEKRDPNEINVHDDQVDDVDSSESEHFKKYRQIWLLLDTMSIINGITLRKGTNWNFGIVLTLIVVIWSILSVLYTAVVVYPNIDDLLQVFCIWGYVLPGTIKFKMATLERKSMVSFVLFCENIFKKIKSGSRADALNHELTNSIAKIKIIVVLIFTGFAIFSLYPFYSYVFEGQLVTIMKIEFPYLDQTELSGFLIGSCIKYTMGVISMFGSTAFDICLAFNILNYGALISLLNEDLKDYHKMYEQKRLFRRREEILLAKVLYIRDLNKYFSSFICYFVSTVYLALIFAVYVVINSHWISVYGYILICYVELAIMCFLGTYVKTQNERLNKILYCTPWYEYPVTVQKIFLLLIHSSAFDTTELWIGKVAPLNVETGKIMTSNIYQYNMAMASMQSE